MVLAPQQPCSSGTHLPCLTDWDQCVLCQKDTYEKLCCPAESQRSNVGSGYHTLADNLLTFSKIGCLPKTIDLSKLDDGEGIQTTVEHHRARLSCLPDFTSKRHHSTLRVTFWIAVDGRKPWSRQELLHLEQPTHSSKPPM